MIASPRLRTVQRRAKDIVSAVLVLCVPLLAHDASAAGDPDLDWWTIQTTHFRVHYDRPLEPIARRVAHLAETIHERVSIVMGYVATEPTEIVLTDDSEAANGSATALPYNTIRLFVTAPEDLSTIGDYDDWYVELVTHEYTHIAHLGNISGLPRLANAILGKTVAPNQALPRWITEGIAVVSESHHSSAGRIRSSLFDMYLRADVLEDNIATIDQFSADAFRWPGGDLWYLYGSRFLQWVVDIYGMNTIRTISAEASSDVVPWGINRTIRRATGRTYVELFDGFREYLRRLYSGEMRHVEARGLREGTPITRHGRNAHYPRFMPRAARSGSGEELVYYRDDGHERAGLYRLPLAPARGKEHKASLVARTSGTSIVTFSPEGALLFNSVGIFKNYYARNDLYRVEARATSTQGHEPERRRLTVGLRAEAPDLSPDGRRVVFTVNTKGTTFLEIADIGAEGALVRRRDLVASARFEQAYTPRFSPDGRSVAYSVWTSGGYRDLRIVDIGTGRVDQVTHDRAIDMTPVWSPEGRTLYFSSDRTGIFNIYAYDVIKRSFSQVTNVRTGAFQPAVRADGKQLVYVGYSSRGFDLFSMELDPATFLPAADSPLERPEPPDSDGESHRAPERYDPLPTVGPRSYLVQLANGNYGPNALTISANGSDAVGHHNLDASVTIEPNAPEPKFSLGYTYSRLPVDLQVEFFHQVLPRSGFLVNNQPTPYDEYTTGITTGIGYNHQGDFDHHSAGLSFSVANFRGTVPFSSRTDPFALSQASPPSGNINVAHLGYGYSTVEGSIETAGAARGVAFSVALDYASPYTGSEYTVRGVSGGLTLYLPMPWRGHHTLAARTAGGVSDGNYPHGGVYTLGGYDFASNSPPSTILSGVFNGAYVLRGYPPRVYAGAEYVLENIEYRVPVAKVDRGLSSLPVYLRRVDANAFLDYGGAFDHFDPHTIHFFHDGAFIDTPLLHCSVGGEIWFGMTLGYVISTQLRFGYAYGFSAEAIKGGQPYFVGSAAF